MGQLNPLAKELLVKICRRYNQTGETTIYTTDITTAPNADTLFRELESAGYLEFKESIAPNIDLLPKAIEFARSIRE